jgi:hypothetical protein
MSRRVAVVDVGDFRVVSSKHAWDRARQRGIDLISVAGRVIAALKSKVAPLRGSLRFRGDDGIVAVVGRCGSTLTIVTVFRDVSFI